MVLAGRLYRALIERWPMTDKKLLERIDVTTLPGQIKYALVSCILFVVAAYPCYVVGAAIAFETGGFLHRLHAAYNNETVRLLIELQCLGVMIYFVCRMIYSRVTGKPFY